MHVWRRGGQRPPWIPTLGPALVLTFTWLALAACGDQQVDYPARQIPDGLLGNPAQIEAGETIFKAKCASCHGKPSEGRSGRAAFFEPPAPDFTEERYRSAKPAYLYWRIEVGKTVEPYLSQGSVMPAWSG
ncbi:MAG: hypothetical protein C0614_01075, partial [Desulfuromonas sp.]